MKTKIKQFEQYLWHDVEEDDEKADDFLEEAIPYIGLVVMHFNGLESDLDSVLCEHFTDRHDRTGMIVLNNLSFSQKIDLMKRFTDEFHTMIATPIPGFEKLINDLRESARLRNMVVHANWESTNEKGYTFFKLKVSKKGMEQYYAQFTAESLEKIIDLIIKVRSELGNFWESRNDILYGRV